MKAAPLMIPGLLNKPPLVEVQPVINYFVRSLCRQPYPRHPRGCPNVGRPGCPPSAPFFDQYFDLGQPAYAIVNEFDLSGHVESMRGKHPDWSEPQLACCLYWQPRARLYLRKAIKQAYLPGHTVTSCPEAMGVDVTDTLKKAGIILEWPPVKTVRQVAFMAVARKTHP